MSVYLKIYDFISGYKDIFFFLILIVLIQSSINFFSVIFFGSIIAIITKNNLNLILENDLITKLPFEINSSNLGFIILFFCISLFLLSVINLCINYYSLKIKFKITKNYLNKILKSIFESQFSFFNSTNKGKLINSFVNEIDKVGSGIVTFARIIPTFFQCIIFISLPFFINFKISLYVYFILILLSLPMIPLTKMGKNFGTNNTKMANIFLKYLGDSFSNKTFLISQNKFSIIIDKIIDSYKKTSNFAIKSGTLDGAPQIILPSISILVIVIFIEHFDLLNSSYLVDLSMIIFSLYRLLPLLASIYGSHLKLYTFNESFNQLEILSIESKKNKLIYGNKKINNIENIKLSSINYLDDSNNKILDKINFNFKIGKINLIYGESGSGKSTIFHLITRYKEPFSGEISINGKQIYELDLPSYRNQISLLGQDVVIFNASLRENLTWFHNVKVTDKKISSIFKKLNLTHLINNKNKSLDLMISDISETISGGEKQRIALARCLISDPNIILLDEITSSLDKENSRLILNLIKTIARTKLVIAISHDPIWINSNLNKFYVSKNI